MFYNIYYNKDMFNKIIDISIQSQDTAGDN